MSSRPDQYRSDVPGSKGNKTELRVWFFVLESLQLRYVNFIRFLDIVLMNRVCYFYKTYSVGGGVCWDLRWICGRDVDGVCMSNFISYLASCLMFCQKERPQIMLREELLLLLRCVFYKYAHLTRNKKILIFDTPSHHITPIYRKISYVVKNWSI